MHLACISNDPSFELNPTLGKSIHYPIPIHLQPAARFLGYEKGSFKSAEIQAKRILTLPVNQHLKHNEVKKISEKINYFYMKN